MSQPSEWDLLVVADDIEQGDEIVVEADGVEVVWSYVKDKDARTIILKDRQKSYRYFSKANLEERDGDYVIIGKKED